MFSQMLVGRDVAKAPRDIALRPTGDRGAVPNDAPGLAALVVRLQAVPPTLRVLEATGGAPTGPWSRPGLGRPGPSWSSLPARSGTVRKRPGRGPNLRPSMPVPWPTVPRRCGRRGARGQTRSPQRGGPSWRGGGTASRGGRPSRTAAQTRRHACGPTSGPIAPGSISTGRSWMTTGTRRDGQAPSGASARPDTGASPALGRCVPGGWGSTARRWARSAASASPPWSALRRASGPGAPCGGPAPCART